VGAHDLSLKMRRSSEMSLSLLSSRAGNLYMELEKGWKNDLPICLFISPYVRILIQNKI